MSDSVPSRRSASLKSPSSGARSSCLLTALHGLWMAIAVCTWNPALGVGYICPWTVDGSSLIEPQGEIPTHAHHTCTQHTQHTRIQTHNIHRVGCKTWICHFTCFIGPVKFRSKHFYKQIQQSVASVDCQVLQHLSCALPNPEACIQQKNYSYRWCHSMPALCRICVGSRCVGAVCGWVSECSHGCWLSSSQTTGFLLPPLGILSPGFM